MSIKSELHEAILRKGGKIPTHGGIAAALDALNRLPGGGGVTSWNDLPDRPFGTEIKNGVALDIFVEPINEDGFVSLDYEIVLFEGEQYTVKYDAYSYNCTAQSIEDSENGYSAIVLGNIGAMMGEEGTGENFVLMVAAGKTNIFPLDGKVLVNLTVTGLTEVVKKIDEKYLPKDDGVDVLYVDYTVDRQGEDANTFHLKCPWVYNQIKDMVFTGKHHVVARCAITDEYIVHLPFNALYLGVLQFVGFNANRTFSNMLVIEHKIDGVGDEYIYLTTHEISLT